MGSPPLSVSHRGGKISYRPRLLSIAVSPLLPLSLVHCGHSQVTSNKRGVVSGRQTQEAPNGTVMQSLFIYNNNWRKVIRGKFPIYHSRIVLFDALPLFLYKKGTPRKVQDDKVVSGEGIPHL